MPKTEDVMDLNRKGLCLLFAARRKALLLVNALVDLTLLGVFVLSCMSVASSSYNPFIYFQF